MNFFFLMVTSPMNDRPKTYLSVYFFNWLCCLTFWLLFLLLLLFLDERIVSMLISQNYIKITSTMFHNISEIHLIENQVIFCWYSKSVIILGIWKFNCVGHVYIVLTGTNYLMVDTSLQNSCATKMIALWAVRALVNMAMDRLLPSNLFYLTHTLLSESSILA